MKKTTIFATAVYAIVGCALITTAVISGSSNLSKQTKALVGVDEPISVTASNFKGNPSGNYAGTAWDPDGTNTAKALMHQGIIVFYKSNIPGYGDFYQAANLGNDSTLYKTVRSNEVVHCANGATVEGSHNSHLAYSPNISGMYDGPGHYWCSMNGTAVDPLPGPETNKMMPDLHDKTPVFRFTLPDGTNYHKSASTGEWVSCRAYAGPYDEDDFTYYNSVGDIGKNIHYHCLSFEGGHFEEPVAGGPVPPSTYSASNFSYSSTTCASGNASCGGANTYGTGSCSRGTYFCQTTNSSTRYCSANPYCTQANFTPPGPSWTLSAPTFVKLSSSNNGKTTFESDDSIYFDAKFQATGTWPTSGWIATTVKVSTSTTNFSNPVWQSTIHGTANYLGESKGGLYPGSGLTAGGPYYFCVQYSMWNDGVHTYDTDGTRDQTTNCVVSSDTFTVIAPVVPAPGTCTLGLTLNDGRTTYSGSEFLNYTYTCSPTGTRASSVTVQVVKPDGVATTYNTATNVDTSTMGFSVSNLTAGNYILRACLDAACTSGVASVNFTVVQTVGSTCDNDRVCDSNETMASCPADCVVTGMTCDNDRVCDSNETMASCPADCGATGMTCDNDMVCDSNETMASCPADCGATTVPTVPKACASGEVCPVNSWCSNGKQCYYPNNTLTCTNWGQSCPSGTKVCRSDDTNCIEPGAYGSLTGWCADSMECFSGSQKYCNPNTYSMSTPMPMTCPSGMGFCSPSDINCIEPGGYGSLNGWCKSSMECYTADGSQKYCYQMPPPPSGGMASAMTASCPAGFKMCRPDDNNCLEAGETGSSNAWCAGGAKQCYLNDGSLYCAAASESCPAGAGVCRAGDTMCVEPGKYGSVNGWCGGRDSFQCYKNDNTGMYCGEITDRSDPYAWEKAVCPASTSRCRSDDKYCLELGESGPSGSWCTSGMSKYNSDGTVKCVSSKEYMNGNTVPVTEPVEEICIQVLTTAYNPSNSECKVFATPCNVPDGWEKLGSDKVCKNGKVEGFDVIGDDSKILGQIIEDDIRYLGGLSLQLKKLPSSAAGSEVLQSMINDTLTHLKNIKQSLLTSTKAQREKIKEELDIIHKQEIPVIEQKMADIKPYLDFIGLRAEIQRNIQDYKIELGKIDNTTEYYAKLSEGVERLEGLLNAASTQTGQGLEQLLVAITSVRDEIQNLVKQERENQTGEFFSGAVNDLKMSLDKYRSFMEANNISSRKLGFMLERLRKIVDELLLFTDGKESYTKVELQTISKLVDEGISVRDKLGKWLGDFGFTGSYALSLDEILSHVEKRVVSKMEEMFEGLSDKIELMINDAIQKVAVKVAEFAESLSTAVAERIAQSVTNLTFVAEDHRDTMVETKDNILEGVNELKDVVESSDLSSFEVQAVQDTMEVASSLNWCGDLAENVQSEINHVGLAIELDEDVDVKDFSNTINSYAEENNEECYRTGVASFRDTPTNEWYFGPAEYNTSHGLVKGYSDANGNPTGEFGPANSTLRIEALAMSMRMLDIPTKSGDSGRSDVPEWGNPYYNGAVNSGIIEPGWRWNEPITRLETAQLFYDSVRSLDVDYISEPSTYTAINRYPDRASFGNDPAVEVWTDLGIFEGAGDTGNFNPNNQLLRSEFATMNERFVETLGIETVQ